jgi:hypothetical protein
LIFLFLIWNLNLREFNNFVIVLKSFLFFFVMLVIDVFFVVLIIEIFIDVEKNVDVNNARLFNISNSNCFLKKMIEEISALKSSKENEFSTTSFKTSSNILSKDFFSRTISDSTKTIFKSSRMNIWSKDSSARTVFDSAKTIFKSSRIIFESARMISSKSAKMISDSAKIISKSARIISKLTRIISKSAKTMIVFVET